MEFELCLESAWQISQHLMCALEISFQTFDTTGNKIQAQIKASSLIQTHSLVYKLKTAMNVN